MPHPNRNKNWIATNTNYKYYIDQYGNRRDKYETIKEIVEYYLPVKGEVMGDDFRCMCDDLYMVFEEQRYKLSVETSTKVKKKRKKSKPKLKVLKFHSIGNRIIEI